MGPGVSRLSLPCKFVQFPELFSTATKKGPLDERYSVSGVVQPSSSPAAQRTSGEVSTVDIPLEHTLTKFQALRGQGVWGTCRATVEELETELSRPSTVERRRPGTHPPYSKGSKGHIPVNKHGQRLDYAITRLEKKDHDEFNARKVEGKKPCKWYHLANDCHRGDACAHDHSELSADLLRVLRYQTKRTPCEHGSWCQRIDCIHGHVCQSQRCSRAIVEDCPLAKFHGVDLMVASWIKVAEVVDDVDCLAAESLHITGDDAPMESSFRYRNRHGDYPGRSQVPPGYVPLNEDGQRLDCISKPRTKTIREAYAERYSHGSPPCKWFHLLGTCARGDLCNHDHSEMSDDFKRQLQHNAKKRPCPRGSQCRILDCIFGHVCQNKRCLVIEEDMCRLHSFHEVSPVMTSLVLGEVWEEHVDELATRSSSKQVPGASAESFWF